MLKNIFLLALLTLLNRYIYHIKYSRLYSNILDFSASQGSTALAYCLGGIVVLLLISFLFTKAGLFKIAEFFSNAVLQLSQLCLLALAILNIVFWLMLGENIYLATQFMPLIILFAALFGASYSLRIIDFNFQFRYATMPSVALTLVSLVIVQTLTLT